MAGSVLQAHNLSGGYPGNQIIGGLDLTITSGTAPLGIIGPSGVGKTTLARLLSGDIAPSGGQVTYNGSSIRRLPRRDAKDFRAAVRFQSQDSLTISDPRLTVAGLLKEAVKVARRARRTHATTTAELLAAVGLAEHFGSRAMVTLSGGERQRVALAAAVATRPDVLILDEPFTAVDPQSRGEMVGRLTALLQRLGTAAVVISHDLELVERMCPTVHFLADGHFVASGPMGEVLAHSDHQAVREMAEAATLAIQRFG